MAAICRSHKQPKTHRWYQSFRQLQWPAIHFVLIDRAARHSCLLYGAAFVCLSRTYFVSELLRRNISNFLTLFLVLGSSRGGSDGELRDKAEDQRRRRRTSSARRAADGGGGGRGGGAQRRGGRGAGSDEPGRRCGATKWGARNDLNSRTSLLLITQTKSFIDNN